MSKIQIEEENPMISNNKNNVILAEELLFAVQNNNISKIKQLIEPNQSLLVYRYAPYNYQTILIVACNDQHSMEKVNRETIETLINLGAKHSEPSQNDHWEPIHYTAINANKEKMEAIVQYLSPEELNSLVCCSKNILEKYPFFTNKKVQRTYSNNALNILLKYGNRDSQFYECCELLIEKGVDVNQADSTGVTPDDLVRQLHDDRFRRLLKHKSVVDNNSRTSLTLLKLGNVKRFTMLDITNEEANGFDGNDENTSSCTLLQLCCAKGLTDCVRYILNKVQSPNRVLKKNPEHPIMIAINSDYEDIVSLLLKRIDLVLPSNILLKLQMLYNNKKKISIADKYMKLIMKQLRRRDKNDLQKYLQTKDDLDRTVLHYSVHYRCTETTLTLLTMGASLIDEDIFGYTPLDSIPPAVLEKHFDSCVVVIQDEEDASKKFPNRKKAQQFCVKINYKTLLKNSEDKEQESVFLKHMIQVTSLNCLMNHPVVASFLGLKWEKFKWWVYINLILYFIAYITLLLDGFVFSKDVRQTILPLTIAYILLLFRDLIQILILKTNYLKRVENIIDLFLFGGLTYMVVASWLPRLQNRNLLVAYSIVFLTSTFGIFIQLGNLSYFTVKVSMLKQISVNFFKAMGFYMFPVLAFFFCFYMLSQTEKRHFFDTLYKTITMYAGDSDGNFPEFQFTDNPIFGSVIYLVFVVIIAIILQNLLIGLAVSDLQNIQKQAEFICKKEQARYILKIEKIIFRQYKSSRYLKSLFAKLLRFLQVFENSRDLVIQLGDSNYMYIGEDILGKNTRIHDYDTVRYLKNIFKNISLNDKTTDDMFSNKKLHEKLEKLEALIEKITNSAGNINEQKKNEKEE